MAPQTPKKPRGILLAGNWKMNHGVQETKTFFQSLKSAKAAMPTGFEQVIFPPFLSITTALSEAKGTGVGIGAQIAHFEKSGAFTGEVSGPMLKEIGVPWVLVGHSERRQFFGETNQSVKKRTLSLLQQGFRVMACVGETLEERNAGKTQLVLKDQIEAILKKSADHPIESYLNGTLVLAYEPVWAIGTGVTATPEQAEEAHQFIRKLLWDLQGMEASGRTPILYGGSVNPQNFKDLLACPNVDGALVGGASLKPESYLQLAQISYGFLA